MVGVAFTAVDGSSFQLNSNLIVEGLKGATTKGAADQILLWDPAMGGGAGGYKTFYYYDDGAEAGWCDPSDNYVEDGSYKNAFTPGKGFWFYPVDTKEKTLRFVSPLSK